MAECDSSETPTQAVKRLLRGKGFNLLLVCLGAVANLLLGIISNQLSEYAAQQRELAVIARTSATNLGLLAKDVGGLEKWTLEQIRELKERLREIERRGR